jgi:hypothetical protein
MIRCPYCKGAQLLHLTDEGEFYWCTACMNEIRLTKTKVYVYDQHGRCIREDSV